MSRGTDRPDIRRQGELHFRRRREALAAVAGLLLAACFSERPDPVDVPTGDDVVVEMTTGLAFVPETARARVGQTVVWRNTSAFPHTATGDASQARNASNVVLPDGASPWDSGFLTGGQEFRRTFTVPGEYRYFCIPHESQNMVGRLVVDP